MHSRFPIELCFSRRRIPDFELPVGSLVWVFRRLQRDFPSSEDTPHSHRKFQEPLPSFEFGFWTFWDPILPPSFIPHANTRTYTHISPLIHPFIHLHHSLHFHPIAFLPSNFYYFHIFRKR